MVLVPAETYLQSLKTYVGFDDAASACLAEVRAAVAPHLPAVIDDFYDTIAAHAGARKAITGGDAQIARLKLTLERWLDELFAGPHDDAYLARRSRIGQVHVRINLPQAFMFVAMDRIRVRVTAVVRRALAHDPERLERTLAALHQIMDIDLAIMLETYREDLETRIRAAERLATIGQLAAGIGHELRSPLSVVETSVFLLRQHLARQGELDPKVYRHLDKIDIETKRSAATINDLLELARDRPPHRQTILLARLLEGGVAAAHLPATVAVTVDAPPGATAHVDGGQITRVLTNLLINACQAMDGGGRIWMEATKQGQETHIRVRDAGPGVPAELRGRVFEALFTTKAKGTGLGLALCRRIVEAHAGTIVIEPSAEGACFLVSMPDGAPGVAVRQ